MLEARTFASDLSQVRQLLEVHQALYKGEYKIHDTVFASDEKDKPLSTEFLRLRHVLKNIWNEKEVVVAVKQTRLKKVGKDSVVPFVEQFATIEEAQKYIRQHFSDKYSYAFEFDRTGWQYDLGEDQVDLEDIQGHPSVEVKSATEESLQRLLDTLQIKDVIEGPSVTVIQKLLN